MKVESCIVSHRTPLNIFSQPHSPQNAKPFSQQPKVKEIEVRKSSLNPAYTTSSIFIIFLFSSFKYCEIFFTIHTLFDNL